MVGWIACSVIDAVAVIYKDKLYKSTIEVVAVIELKRVKLKSLKFLFVSVF